MAGDGQKGIATAGKVVAMPRVRKTSLSLTLLEFTHTLILMLWVGSLAGFALVVIPVLFTSLPTQELAARATLAILERTAFLGCGAGAFLLLTTLLMHLLSLRATRATLTQMLLLLAMTGAAVGSQITLTPKLSALMAGLPAPLDALAPADPSRVAFGRLQMTALSLLLFQILAGIGVLVFAVRRWYRYLPVRRDPGAAHGTFLDPRIR